MIAALRRWEERLALRWPWLWREQVHWGGALVLLCAAMAAVVSPSQAGTMGVTVVSLPLILYAYLVGRGLLAGGDAVFARNPSVLVMAVTMAAFGLPFLLRMTPTLEDDPGRNTLAFFICTVPILLAVYLRLACHFGVFGKLGGLVTTIPTCLAIAFLMNLRNQGAVVHLSAVETTLVFGTVLLIALPIVTMSVRKGRRLPGSELAMTVAALVLAVVGGTMLRGGMSILTDNAVPASPIRVGQELAALVAQALMMDAMLNALGAVCI